MHVNFRRPKRWRHRSYKRGNLPCGCTLIEQRLLWKKRRQEVRLRLLHGEAEMIPRYLRHIRWDYW